MSYHSVRTWISATGLAQKKELKHDDCLKYNIYSTCISIYIFLIHCILKFLKIDIILRGHLKIFFTCCPLLCCHDSVVIQGLDVVGFLTHRSEPPCFVMITWQCNYSRTSWLTGQNHRVGPSTCHRLGLLWDVHFSRFVGFLMVISKAQLSALGFPERKHLPIIWEKTINEG